MHCRKCESFSALCRYVEDFISLLKIGDVNEIKNFIDNLSSEEAVALALYTENALCKDGIEIHDVINFMPDYITKGTPWPKTLMQEVKIGLYDMVAKHLHDIEDKTIAVVKAMLTANMIKDPDIKRDFRLNCLKYIIQPYIMAI